MRPLIYALFLTLCAACAGGGSSDGLRDLDLLPYNIPVTIRVPDSVDVKTSNLSGVMDDVTIKSPDEPFGVQVFASLASSNDLAKLKAEQLDLVRSNRYFERIVSEDETGFLFENKIDTTSVYGFRHIVYRGSREFVFQNAFDGIFTLPEVERMYAAVGGGPAE